MCGIFGLAINAESKLTTSQLRLITNDLFRLSESRGKEAAGIAIHSGSSINIYKQPSSATELIRSHEYHNMFNRVISSDNNQKNGLITEPLTVIGHSRLVTNGAQEVHHNNQPVISGGIVGIHNGIVVNVYKIWSAFPDLTRQLEVDTEVIFSLIRHYLHETNSLNQAIRDAFCNIQGATSIATLFEDLNYLALATNNGSLYIAVSEKNNALIFASERYILQMLNRKRYVKNIFGDFIISQIKSGHGCLIDLSKLELIRFSLRDQSDEIRISSNGHIVRSIIDHTAKSDSKKDFQPDSSEKNIIKSSPLIDSFLKEHNRNEAAVSNLRRCTKCVLPETMPFICYDKDGVCNYCNNYTKMKIQGHNALEKAVEKYRKPDGQPDCIVTFSGGRDSSYGLHYIKTVLGMNPIAYTYDWGMVTDLARRNISRICGKLGIEHILVSADIKRKRENIRRNVSAWLKRPDLGTIPLFMAGDKQYFWFANQLSKQTGVELIVLSENMLETTNFKSGYCGIKPHWGTEHTYTLSAIDKARLAAYYGKQYLKNPAYLNRSLMDTIQAFISYYFIPHNYLNLYRYERWEECKIEEILIGEYDWETATDMKSTWRIGDGTASFYNFIYYTLSGFSENDTFRSNQIREDMITREEAMTHISADNKPRFESIQWYCNTIGIDFERAIRTINSANKLCPEMSE